MAALHRHQVVTDYTNVQENANLKVFVRARPPDVVSDEAAATHLFELGSTEHPTGRVRKITMKQWRQDGATEQWGGVGSNAFQFDGVFWSNTTQETIFEHVCREQVDHMLKGYNACCFAYGQTGSGKTHSMFFPRGGQARDESDAIGIIPRAIDYVFQQLAHRPNAELHVSFLEIYCDTIRDLGKASLLYTPDGGCALERTSDLYRDAAAARAETFGMRGSQSGNLTTPLQAPSSSMANKGNGHNASAGSLGTSVLHGPESDHNNNIGTSPLGARNKRFDQTEEIREDAHGNVFVKGLARIPVRSCSEALDIIDRGLSMRATEATSMNDTSSRSHTVFTIEVAEQQQQQHVSHDNDDDIDDDVIPVVGKLHLVDLAGSERIKKSESKGARLQEALHINKSLTALGKVIVSLEPAERKNGTHVPYRDSKLTRILQNALGGDSYTTLLATIRPSRTHAEECLSTLQFANRCRRVANNPRVHRVGENALSRGGSERIRRLMDQVDKLKEERKQLLVKLAAATGDDVEAVLDEAISEEDTHLAAASRDPAYVQSVVVSAVLRTLHKVGLEGRVDDRTGGVILPDGTLLDASTPAAFVGLSKEGQERQKLLIQRLGESLKQLSPSVLAIAARVAAVFGWSPRAIPPGLLAVLGEREAEFTKTRKKLEDTKSELEARRSDLEQLRRRMTTAEYESRRKEHDLKLAIDSATKRAVIATDALKAQHKEELASLTELHHTTTQELAATAKAALPMTTPRPASAAPPSRVVDLQQRLAAARDAAKRAQGRVDNCEATIAALREQYEHWLREKDKEALSFVAQLDVYRRRKRKQLESANTELRTLWYALEAHTTILANLRAGKYPIHQLSNNVAAPRIPKVDLPRCKPSLDGLPTTKRAVAKHSPMMNDEAPPQHDEIIPGEERLKAQLRESRDQLNALRRDFETKVEARVAAELSSHPTIAYMRQLEERARQAEHVASQQTKNHAQLRIAYLRLQGSSTSSTRTPHQRRGLRDTGNHDHPALLNTEVPIK